MNHEFKAGDVIALIGGTLVQVVAKVRPDDKWYVTKYLVEDDLCGTGVHLSRADVHMDYLEAEYVKVDTCNPSDDSDIYNTLMHIAKAVGKIGE